MNTSTNSGPRAGRREWLGLAVLSLPALLITLDFSALNLAVPALIADLRPSSTQLLWIVDVYGFLLAGFLITMGTLGDRIGRRRLLMIGAAAFGAGSVLAAYSPTAETLIAARALLGVAGATLAPSTLSLVSTMFRDSRQRTLAIAVWAMSLSTGGAIGPVVGGVLLEWFWWGSVFLLAVPVMVLLLVTGPVLLPEFRDTTAGRLDLTSVALSLASILPVIYGLKEIAKDGVGTWPTVAIVVGVAVGVLFVRRQRSLADPLIDLRLFARPAFSASLVTNTLAFFVILGIYFLTAQYLQLVLGLSPLQAGLWSVPAMGGLVAGAMLTPLVVRWVRPAFVMTAGLLVAAVGFGILTQVNGLAVLVIGSVVLSLGLAPVTTLVVDMMVGSAPEEKAGAASAISETSTEFGGALGIAVLGSVAGQLPESHASTVLGPAGEAFTSGLAVAATIGAAVVTALAVVTMAMLRNVRPGGVS